MAERHDGFCGRVISRAWRPVGRRTFRWERSGGSISSRDVAVLCIHSRAQVIYLEPCERDFWLHSTNHDVCLFPVSRSFFQERRGRPKCEYSLSDIARYAHSTTDSPSTGNPSTDPRSSVATVTANSAQSMAASHTRSRSILGSGATIVPAALGLEKLASITKTQITTSSATSAVPASRKWKRSGSMTEPRHISNATIVPTNSLHAPSREHTKRPVVTIPPTSAHHRKLVRRCQAIQS